MKLFDNKYNFVKDLGTGGFGKVFLAKEKVSNRFVAIKQLKNTNKAEQAEIIHEIEIVSRFENSHIVSYYHHFWEEEKLFLVMEYCSGGSLRDRMDDGSIPIQDALQWIQTLATCLRTVHKKGIIHHDIKPDNILFSHNGNIKISDFGIANKDCGTRSYMAPESFNWDIDTKQDPRIDIYALGVTMMEVLTGKNPFLYLSKDDIVKLHQKAEFPIQQLPNWQQEIILKAINKVPELRFQFMVEFEEAIKAKAVPVVFKKENLKAAELVEHANKALKTNKWRNAEKYLHLANKTYPDNVAVLQAYGKFCLRTQQIEKAKEYLDRALRFNTRLDVQKDLGWINLENKKYPIAVGLLSDHLHRNPSDYEAYNLLIRCYYETGRYEPAMELSKMLMETNNSLPCFANNYYISYAMHHNGKEINPDTILKKTANPFIEYNYSILKEKQKSHNFKNKPSLKSKLLFMDFHFNTIKENTLTIVEHNNKGVTPSALNNTIIKFGRNGYTENDIEILGELAISRRHCIIINSKDNVWLYDLESTGTKLNNEKVNVKIPLIGFNTIAIGAVNFSISTDSSKLL